MKRLKETFLPTLESVISLQDADVLEIGCGNGSRAIEIASRCRTLTGIDPDMDLLYEAWSQAIPNAKFQHGSAEKLDFVAASFDVVIFTLSFHHIPIELMSMAIDEAIRVLKEHGRIVFLEPGTRGTFFEAEIAFDACDGDERTEKLAAYQAMRNHSGLKLVCEIPDETIFQFESIADFLISMQPRKGTVGLRSFLEAHSFILNAERRIDVFEIA
jgi:ubiquinone/menaquinone biosynthesis C-methylase UbiE